MECTLSALYSHVIEACIKCKMFLTKSNIKFSKIVVPGYQGAILHNGHATNKTNEFHLFLNDKQLFMSRRRYVFFTAYIAKIQQALFTKNDEKGAYNTWIFIREHTKETQALIKCKC